MRIPVRYLPKKLTRKDKSKQVRMLMRSRRLYKNNKYYTRKEVPSYKSKTSSHIVDARRIYNIKNEEKDVVYKDSIIDTMNNQDYQGIIYLL
jgi:hypothetical protein